jgi:hypothetical protein
MIIGKHEETLRWELGPLQQGILGYLPVSWMNRHNPDINWTTGTLRWRSDFCHKHCLPVEVKIELMTEVELLTEKPENVYQIGATIYHDENGDDIAQRLPYHYWKYADIFSQKTSRPYLNI